MFTNANRIVSHNPADGAKHLHHRRQIRLGRRLQPELPVNAPRTAAACEARDALLRILSASAKRYVVSVRRL
jgi:hypothetical protein